MHFHHVCVIVSDLERAVDMWTTLFDFTVDSRFTAPDDAMAAAPDSTFPKLMEDIWGMPGTRTKLALLSSPGGAKLELQEALNPKIRELPREYHSYYYTGIREIAFQVQGIDAWFDKIKAAGFELQTDYVWNVSGTGRTFQFYDHDHHLIQLWEDPTKTGW
jgi:catechol 2,3-dioxygenase-like lactoylglutathione lyase family enzyme